MYLVIDIYLDDSICVHAPVDRGFIGAYLDDLELRLEVPRIDLRSKLSAHGLGAGPVRNLVVLARVTLLMA